MKYSILWDPPYNNYVLIITTLAMNISVMSSNLYHLCDDAYEVLYGFAIYKLESQNDLNHDIANYHVFIDYIDVILNDVINLANEIQRMNIHEIQRTNVRDLNPDINDIHATITYCLGVLDDAFSAFRHDMPSPVTENDEYMQITNGHDCEALFYRVTNALNRY